MSNDFVQDTVEQIQPFLGSLGVAGAVTGTWADMGAFSHAGVLLQVNNAAEELTMTLQQATDTSGTGAKALQVRRVYARLEGEVVYTLVSETPAASYVLPAGSGASDVVIEVKESDFDTANDFKALQCNVVGSTARIQSVTYLLGGASYKPAGMVDAT